jgi:hypothetical protein
MLRKELDRRAENNTSFVAIESSHDIWSEDAAELHADRSVAVAPPLPPGFDPVVETLKARLARFCPDVEVPADGDTTALFALLREHAPTAAHSTLGEVFNRETQLSYVGLALASGQEVRANLCAIEGGNLLVTTDAAGKTHAVVGRDSFDLTKRALQAEIGTRATVTDDLVMQALATDTGLSLEQIHVVEQPGAYHLDVMMTPVAPGEFVVNDSLVAARRGREWALADHARKEPRPPRVPTAEANERFRWNHELWVESGAELQNSLQRLDDIAQRNSVGEARAQADLEKAGFKVHRVAAVYPWAGMLPMNFLNAEQGRGQDGQRFYVALGGDRRGEKAFLDDMKAIGRDVARFYFLDRELTFGTLQAGGGISCRCKAERS